jgi:hypothetical protein
MTSVAQVSLGVFLKGAQLADDLSRVLTQRVLDAWLMRDRIAQVAIVKREVVGLRHQSHRDPMAQLPEHRSRDVALVVQDERGLGLMDRQFRVPIPGDLPVRAGAGRDRTLAVCLPEQPIAVIPVVKALPVPLEQKGGVVKVDLRRTVGVMRLARQREDGGEPMAVLRSPRLLDRHGYGHQGASLLRGRQQMAKIALAMTGRVTNVHSRGGYFWIRTNEARVFFGHRDQLQGGQAAFDSLRIGSWVTFNEYPTRPDPERKPRATSIKHHPSWFSPHAEEPAAITTSTSSLSKGDRL